MSSKLRFINVVRRSHFDPDHFVAIRKKQSSPKMKSSPAEFLSSYMNLFINFCSIV